MTLEVSDSTAVRSVVDDAEQDVRDAKKAIVMSLEASDSTKVESVVNDAEQNMRDADKAIVVENVTIERQRAEEKNEENEAVIDDDDEEYFSETSSSTEEEEEEAEEPEEEEDDAYALLALAKRSIAQAKVAEENVKAEEVKAVEALKKDDDDEEDVHFDDDVIEAEEEMIAQQLAANQSEKAPKQEMTPQQPADNQSEKAPELDLDKEEIHLPVITEAQLTNNAEGKSKSDEKVTELKDTNNRSDKADQGVTSNDIVSEEPKKRREENAELWALLQASKHRLSLTQHHLKPDKPKISKQDSEDESCDKEKATNNPENFDEEKQRQNGSILEDEEHELDHNQQNKQQHSLNSTEANDGITTSRTNQHELDAEKDKEKRRKENAELWELLVQSKRRLEISSPSTDTTSTGTSTGATTPTNDHGVSQEKKNYLEDYVLPNEVENEEKDFDSDSDDPDEYDRQNDDEAAVRLSAKELLIAMATAEEAAMSGKDYHKTDVLQREELKRDLDTFAFIKSKCSISGPKRFQNRASSTTSGDTPTGGLSSITPLFPRTPKREKVISSFIASIKGLRTKTNKVTKAVTTSPYSSPKYTGKKSTLSSTSSTSIAESSSLMMEKFKKSVKDFNETISTIDSNNTAKSRSTFVFSDTGPTVVSCPPKIKKWQERAAVVAGKNKK